MKICPKCGASYEDSARFCPICGTDASAVSMKAPAEEGGQPAGPTFSGPAPGAAGTDFGGYGRDGSAQGSPFGSQSGSAQGSPFGSQGGSAQGSPFGSQGGSAQGSPFGSQGGPGYDRGQPYPNGPQNAGPASYQPGRQPYNEMPPFVSPYDHTDEYEEKDISENKVIAMCIYLLGTIGLFIALLCQKSEYVSFHIRQSLKLTVVQTLVWICAGILSFVLSILGLLFGAATMVNRPYYTDSLGSLSVSFSLGIGTVPLVIATICTAAIFVIRIICFVQICKGKVVEAPLVRSLGFLK